MAKPNIHPKYFQIQIICITCNNNFISGSTKNEEIHVDTCSNCHPFYTGKKNIILAKGRVERFNIKTGHEKSLKQKNKKINKIKTNKNKLFLLENSQDILKLNNDEKK